MSRVRTKSSGKDHSEAKSNVAKSSDGRPTHDTTMTKHSWVSVITETGIMADAENESVTTGIRGCTIAFGDRRNIGHPEVKTEG